MLPAQALSLIRLCCSSRDSAQSLGSSRSPDARIVKKNNFMIGCETVRYRRIPAVHIGVEVLQKEREPSLLCRNDDRHSGFLWSQQIVSGPFRVCNCS